MQLQEQQPRDKQRQSYFNRHSTTTLNQQQFPLNQDLDSIQPLNTVSSVSPKRPIKRQSGQDLTDQELQARTPGTVSGKRLSNMDLNELNFQVQLNTNQIEFSPQLAPHFSQADEQSYQTSIRQLIDNDDNKLNRTISSKYEEEQHSSKSSQLYSSPSVYQKRVTDSKIEQVQQLYQGQSSSSKNNSSNKKPTLRQSFTSGVHSLQQQNSTNNRLAAKASSATKANHEINNFTSEAMTEESGKGFYTLVNSQSNHQYRYDSMASSAAKNKSESKIGKGVQGMTATEDGSSAKKRSQSKTITTNSTAKNRNSHIRSFSTRQDNFAPQASSNDIQGNNTRKSIASGYQSLKRAVEEVHLQSSSTTPQKKLSQIGYHLSNSKNPFGQSSNKKSQQKQNYPQLQYDSIEPQPSDIYQMKIGQQSTHHLNIVADGSIKRTKYLKKIEQHIHPKPFQKNSSSANKSNLQASQLNNTLGSSHSLRALEGARPVANAKAAPNQAPHSSTLNQQYNLKSKQQIQNAQKVNKAPTGQQTKGKIPSTKNSQAKLSSVNQSHIQLGSQLQQSQFIEEGDSLMMQDISFFNQNSTANLTAIHNATNKSLAGSKSTRNIQAQSFISNAVNNGRVQRLFRRQVINQCEFQAKSPRADQIMSKSVSENTMALSNNLKVCSSEDLHPNESSYADHKPLNPQTMVQQQTPSSSSVSSEANEDARQLMNSKKSVVHVFSMLDQEAIEEEFMSKSKSMGIAQVKCKGANQHPQLQQRSQKPVIYDENNDQYFLEDSLPSTNKNTQQINITNMVLDYQKNYQLNIQKTLIKEQLEALELESSLPSQQIYTHLSPEFNLQQLDTQRYRDSNYDLNDRVEEQSENVIEDESTNKAADSPFSHLGESDSDFRKRANSAGLLPQFGTPHQQNQRAIGAQAREVYGSPARRENNGLDEGSFLGNENGKSQFDAITVQRNIQLEDILKFLIEEEELLNNFCQMVQQGQLIEMQSQLSNAFSYQYLDLIQSVDCKKERPKFFAQQLQVTVVLTNALIEIFSPALIQKFSLKLRTIYTNLHQNFVLLIDQILNCCNVNPKDSINYIILRKLIVKKLKNKLKSKRITLLRQNNEVNLLNVKKICRHMATYGSMTQIQGTGDVQMNLFHSEFKVLGNEMLEILRTFDKIPIQAILHKISLKDEIVKLKKLSIQQQSQQVGVPGVAGSPQKRRTSQKNQSPKFSPRMGTQHNYSPAQSSKSNKSNRNSITSNSSKDNKPKRQKPQFESLRKGGDPSHSALPNKQSPQAKVSQKLETKKISEPLGGTQMASKDLAAAVEQRMKSRTEYSEANHSLQTESAASNKMQHSNQSSQKQTAPSNQTSSNQTAQGQNQANGMFFLPESIAFILSNSVQTSGNGVTNINNNISIYNTAIPSKSPQNDIDLRILKQDARNAQLMGKINIKTGKVEVIQSSKGGRDIVSPRNLESFKSSTEQSQPKRTGLNQNCAPTNKRQAIPSPKKFTVGLNKSSVQVQSQALTHNQSNASLGKAKKKLSKQNLSRQTSKLDQNSQIGDEEEFMKLNFDQVDLTRDNSGASNLLSLAHSPSKRVMANRPLSKQPQSQQLDNSRKTSNAASNSSAKPVPSRPKSRQGQCGANIKSQQVAQRRNYNNLTSASGQKGTDTESLKSETESIASTPLKTQNNEQQDYITNISLATDKSYKPILSGAKKHQPMLSANAKAQVQGPTRSPAGVPQEKLAVPSKNIKIVSPQPRINSNLQTSIPGKSFIAKAVSQQKHVKASQQQHRVIDKISEFQISHLNEMESQLAESDHRDRFFLSDTNLVFNSNSNEIKNFIATQPFDRGYIPTPDVYPDSARNMVPTALNFNSLGDTQSFDNRLQSNLLYHNILGATQNMEDNQSLPFRDQQYAEDYLEEDEEAESIHMMEESKYHREKQDNVQTHGVGASYNKIYSESTAEKVQRRRDEEEAERNEKEELDLFILNETRLNLLLDKMNLDIQTSQREQHQQNEDTRAKEQGQNPQQQSLVNYADQAQTDRNAASNENSARISIENTPKQRRSEQLRSASGAQTPREQTRKSTPFELSPGVEDSPNGKSRLLQQQFGNLLEQHMDSLDLKKEMEKLKQLDEEQKKLKRISLKINTRQIGGGGDSYAHSQNQSVASSGGQLTNQSLIESPGKKILIGEFDETNQEDEAFYFKDDLLLSVESKKHVIYSHQQNQMEVVDFQDYITQKTGMQDPFPDHLDPDEEAGERAVKDFKLSDEMEALRKDQEENERLKSQVKIPYLPPLEKNEYHRTYTLVLDLDETLIHFECDEEEQDEDEQGYYLIRPGAIKFLNELSKYYELVVFTAAMPDYADWILDNVDRHQIIKHRLYRQHTTPHEDYAIKDLRNLGRALERTIIIDNLAENFSHTTPSNGIWVESWYDDMDDTVMELLIPFLKDIVESRTQDVRKVLTTHNKENIIYRCLEENKEIPSVGELLQTTAEMEAQTIVKQRSQRE